MVSVIIFGCVYLLIPLGETKTVLLQLYKSNKFHDNF